MACYHLLPLILALISLLILSPSSHAATKAMFSVPLQFLFGGQSLTDGDLTLSLSNDCGLILYKDGNPVVDFNTSTTTSHCALLVNKYGQLLLAPDNERTRTQIIGNKSPYSGRYALLFLEGKLGIFGPAIWNNGVERTTTLFNINKPTLHQEKLKTGYTDYILLSGNVANGSANGDVVIAQNDDISAVITEKCTISVKDDTTSKTIWSSWPSSAEATECFLELTSHGELLLQGYNESGVYTQWSGGCSTNENLYVCLLRYNGRITIYGLKTWLYDGSSSSAAAASVVVVAENIEMVTT